MRGVRCREQRAAATRCGLPGEACRARCGSLSFLQSLIRSYMCVLDHSHCDQLARPAAVRGMRCRAKLVAVTRRGVPGKVLHPRRPGEAWRRSRRAKRAAAAWGQRVPSMHPRADDTGRLEARLPTLLWRAATGHSVPARCHATGRQTSPSVTAAMKHHLRLHC